MGERSKLSLLDGRPYLHTSATGQVITSTVDGYLTNGAWAIARNEVLVLPEASARIECSDVELLRRPWARNFESAGWLFSGEGKKPVARRYVEVFAVESKLDRLLVLDSAFAKPLLRVGGCSRRFVASECAISCLPGNSEEPLWSLMPINISGRDDGYVDISEVEEMYELVAA